MSNKTKKKFFIICGIILMILALIVALILYINATKTVIETVIPDTTPIYTTVPEAPVYTVETSEAVISENIEVFDDSVTIDVDDLFNPVKEVTGNGLSQLVASKAEEALTVTFDNITFCPGMRVCDITDISDWYTLRENDILEPGEKAYAVLNNDFWDNESLRLNDDYDNSNCEVVVWVQNYSNEPQTLITCPIYKYKISCRNGIDTYMEHPVLKYMEKYGFGYLGVYPESDHTERVTADSDVYVQLIYGDINECQVIIDKFDDFGMFAITVSYNEYYGPYFGRRE